MQLASVPKLLTCSDNTTMLWALGAYFVYITIWLARFLMKFRKPRDA